jgi:ribosomal protein L11 methyltransferase
LAKEPSSDWIRVEFDISAGDRDSAAALLWELDTIGFEETDSPEGLRLAAFFRVEAGPPALQEFLEKEADARGLRLSRLSVDSFHSDGEFWLLKCRQQFHGFPIGGVFYIHPSWESPAAGYPVTIQIEPGHGFGTGTHESTQLCLLALAETAAGAESFLDVGTGSGILSIAARKLNPAIPAAAFDVDHLACEAALENFKNNNLNDILLFTGQLSALKRSFDLVVANLTESLFRQLAGGITGIAGRRLIVSGFTDDQRSLVLDSFRAAGPLSPAREWSQDGWRCLLLQKTA